MLVSLHVKNLALIDETEVFFGEGLNILSGETGAGKSIIIGSVNLALGAKADKELIRTGAEYASVELVFQMQEENLEKIADLEIPVEEDGLLIIQRRIQPARSICKVNGETVTAKQVIELAEFLIDIHGQHEHQSLLHKKKHLEILDDYSGDKIHKIKEELRKDYKVYESLKKELEESALDEEARKRELALAEFEAGEIEEASLVSGEDEEVEKSYRKMVNSQKIMEAFSQAYGCINSEDGQGASGQVGRALKEIKAVASYDEEAARLQDVLEDIDSMLSDLNHSLSRLMDDMEFDEFTFRQTEERLNLLNHLKSKYGKSLDEVISYGETIRKKAEKLSDYENYQKELEEKVNENYKKVLEDCKKVSKIRTESALKLEKQMKNALIDLNFLDVQFEIQVRPDEKNVHAGGYDEVEFMISTNPGESIKPLGMVASGGELSRIMLALKTVLAKKDKTDTLIFDEIDAGISGKTAWKVSEKLGILGREHQVICITHLPQIAAMADNHFLIEKTARKDKTTTTIREIKEEESIKELARLLGSEKITDSALSNAKELKELAAKTKQS